MRKAGNGQRHAVIGWGDPGRQFAYQRFIIHVHMQVGEDGAGGLHPRDPFQGAAEMGMCGWMRRAPQRIDDPAVHAFKRREGVFVQPVDIG